MRNRFYQTPYSTGFGIEQAQGEAAFRAVRAEGGWAVVSTDICSVHPESDLRGFCADSRIWSADDVRALAQIADAVHEHDALAGIELYYGGAVGPNDWTRLPARGVSNVPGDMTWNHTPYEMDTREIAELRHFFVEAALRSREAGFDLINLCANSQMNIIQQFLLPFYNRRTDEYGGSLENRVRFLRETLEEIREVIDDCAITVRLTVETFAEGERGFHANGDGRETVALLDHLVDLWDLDVGGMAPSAEVAKWGVGASPSRQHSSGWETQWIEAVRPATKKPIVGVGRFTSPDLMASVIRDGPLDIIGAARPGLSDPFLPQKIEHGEIEDLRECIGCNVCVMRYSRWVPVNCTQNPTAGEEYRRGWHPEDLPKAADRGTPILVVGAGPAGMECATVLGKRGFENVHLVDEEKRPGGAMRWIPRLPGLGEWARVVDYREVQLGKLPNVQHVPRKRLEVEDVLDYGAEIVICATGAHWATDGLNPASQQPIPGASAAEANVITPEQLMVGEKTVPGTSVLIYDCDNYFMGVSVAERLADQGKQVTIMSPAGAIAGTTFYTEEGPDIMRRMVELGIVMEPGYALESFADGKARVRGTLMGDLRDLEADSLVLVTQRVPNDDLYRELQRKGEQLEQDGIRKLLRVGDCVAPRILADAIFDGHRLGREVDDPGRPEISPFLIEGQAA